MRPSPITLAALATCALLALAPDTQSQTLAVDPITGTNPNTSNPFLGAGATLAPTLIFTGISRGTGINGTTANDRYNANNWTETSLPNAIAANDFFSWSLGLPPGLLFDFTGGTGVFNWGWQVSSTGPTNWALRSSLDSFATDLASGTMPGGGGGGGSGSSSYAFTGPFDSLLSAPVSFRLYGWGASSSAGTFSVNNYSISGLIVPEPSRALLLALAASLALLPRRRPSRR